MPKQLVAMRLECSFKCLLFLPHVVTAAAATSYCYKQAVPRAQISIIPQAS
jgi:hypothetical protein